MKNIKNKCIKSLLFIVIALLAAVSIKGDKLKFEHQLTQDLGGPYEASNSRGRFMLTQAIAESGTFFLTRDQAAFSLPDLAMVHNKYISIFTPGISFMGLPLYIVGKLFGIPQITTFLLNYLVGILNVYLVFILARKLGASKSSAYISGFLFLFGTNCLSYATTFTQHPLSATMILLGVINVAGKRTILNNVALGYWFGLAATLDIPNIVIFVPVLLYATSKHIFTKKTNSYLELSFSPKLIAILIGALPFIFAFAWYNHTLTGSYTAIPQLLGRITTLDPKPEISLTPPSTAPFEPRHFALNSRNLIRGVYTLVISSERSWIYYSPFIIFGILGLLTLVRKEATNSLAYICIAVGTINLLTYMLFGDPWGGWAFGPRYLIPGAAVLSAGFGPWLDRLAKKWYWLAGMFIISLYSVAISLAGSLTTNLIPPKVEAVAMSTPTPYNYTYNFILLFQRNQTGSLLYNTMLSNTVTPAQFYLIYLSLTALPLVGLFSLLTVRKGENYA